MRPNIDFIECLKDSPNFRASLEDAEDDIDTLESKLEKLVKLCSHMIEAGKTFNHCNSAFINGVKDLGYYFREDKLVSETLERFAHGMKEMSQFQTILLDQAHRSVCKNLKSFITNDIKKVKETRKHFEKISDDTDNSLIKNAQTLKSRPLECDEANNVVTAMKSCFQHTSLDYVFQINLLHSKKRCDVLHTMLSYMHAQNAYFHQGYDLFVDLEPYMKTLASQLEELNKKTGAEKRAMEERHALVQQQKDALAENGSTGDNEIKMDGYLFKRTSKGFKSWVRRWFMIHKNQLVYRKRTKDSVTVMEEDLRLCTVKPINDTDRRFCFEVLSPARSHILQADSDTECQAWISAIQTGVTEAYRDRSHTETSEAEPTCTVTSSVSTSSRNSVAVSVSSDERAVASEPRIPQESKASSRMSLFMSIPGNTKCCDCGSPDPRWASINLGTIVCIECSGIHRSLGVHMSKVRSVTLDAWEPELLKVMAELGNDVVNSIFEACVDETIAKRATPMCNRDIREAWIKAKYVQKAFVKKLPGQGDQPSSSKFRVRKWSVYKRSRRSPSRKLEIGDHNQNAPGLAQGDSKDSGLGNSSPDVIVFGSAAPENEMLQKNLEIESSESDEDSAQDSDENKSTTSWEEVTNLDPNLLLFKAAEARNLPVMMQAFAQGADVNWQNEEDEGRSVLMKAVESGCLTACEFLMLNGGKVDRKDLRGRTPLHHASIMGHTAQVCQLLKRGANQHAVDESGLDALTIAVDAANADIVTLLRLAKLNEEMKESEGYYGLGDETFSDVFRDFTNLASNEPEKLKRNPSYTEV